MFNPVVRDLNSFIDASRLERIQAMTTGSPRASSYYPPVPSQPITFDSQSEITFNPPAQLRSYSPEDLQKLKYKVDLDKQVAEKNQRRAHEWEVKIQRDRKYVEHQPFGRHHHSTVITKHELEELLTKGRAPSPDLEKPQQFPLNHPTSQIPNDDNSVRPLSYHGHSPYPNYSTVQTRTQSPQKNDSNQNIKNSEFHNFYGPPSSATAGNTQRVPSSPSASSHPIKGDPHDPFILFDPNKESQNVFNIVPQQDLYDPWGRPGGGAPLIHQPTGQKFTRYSGSLQEKLNAPGPLGFRPRVHSGNLEEQKRDLELEQRRRHQELMEHRSNVGNTAEWISHIESSRYPLKRHLSTTETTREYVGEHSRYRSPDSRTLHDDLVRQAAERALMQQMNRYQNGLAELQHNEVQNTWWGRRGGGAPSSTIRRHNVENTFERPRPTWTANHLGQLTLADDDSSRQIKLYDQDYIYPKSSRSNHRNHYDVPDNKNT